METIPLLAFGMMVMSENGSACGPGRLIDDGQSERGNDE